MTVRWRARLLNGRPLSLSPVLRDRLIEILAAAAVMLSQRGGA
ncbi:hypothetical protein [Geminicoccus sp.]|jgi:hypothetical protein|nr:hypothetical protein [Geminicoccus sp.]